MGINSSILTLNWQGHINSKLQNNITKQRFIVINDIGSQRLPAVSAVDGIESMILTIFIIFSSNIL